MPVDVWNRILDSLDRIDSRLRAVEIECESINTKLDANKSRVSREVAKQTEADESLSERVEKLELEAAEKRGASTGAWKLYLAIAAAAGTTSGGAIKALGAVFGS
jgi:hypothetical protein